MGRWNSYRKLSRADRQMLLLMSLMLPIIAAAVRCLGFRRAFSIIGRLTKQPDIDTIPQPDVFIARVRKNTRYMKLKGLYHGNCLSRSLMMWLLLRRKGVCCDLVVGSRFRDGEFQAHAWVEHNSQALNASRRVRQRYAVFEHSFVPDQKTQSLTQ